MRCVKDKVVVITGASKGIGAAVARIFAAEQARLVLSGRNKARLEKVARSLDLPKNRVTTVVADVSKLVGMRKIISTAYRKYGVVDIFINNAGVGLRDTVINTTEEEYNLMMDTNVKAVFHCFKELLPRMMKQDFGQIINISSLAGRMGVPGLSVYSASKAALNAFSEAVAGEVRNENIKICVLSPGSTETDFGSGLRRRRSRAASGSTVKLTVEEVAEAVLFLARQNRNAFTSMADIRPLITKK
ncbi:MAG: SDR family oxidoreductase [Candidatus Zixiibacteriota bacterium]|nr:MAG: SDR family oxidoreductase [candidate division Zixibacteria bacterium]